MILVLQSLVSQTATAYKIGSIIMLREIEIEVTAEHIKNGRRGSCGSCPVALAILSKLKHIPYHGSKNVDINSVVVHVSYDIVRFYQNYPNTQEVTAPPPEVGLFISKFDSASPVQPFKFKLAVPANLIA